MKKSKKFLKVLSATAIAAIMATTMASTAAFAAVATPTPQNIAVKSSSTATVTGTWKAYKVATATVDGNVYKYEWVAGLSDFVTDLPDMNTLSGYSDEQVKAFAVKLTKAFKDTTKTNSSGQTLGATIVPKTGSIGETKQDFDPGYYLIVTEDAAIAKGTTGEKEGVIIDPVLREVSSKVTGDVTLKYSTISVDKAITGIDVGSYDISGNIAEGTAGSVVNYSITTTLPEYDTTLTAGTNIEDFVITDQPSANLTINNDIAVTVNNTPVSATSGETKTYTLTSSNSTTDGYAPGKNGGTGFNIVFDDDYVLAHKGETVVVTFTATIAKTAELETATPNDVKLTYGNDFSTGGGKKELTDETDVFRTELNVFKKDSNGDALADAGFTLYSTETFTDEATQYKIAETIFGETETYSIDANGLVYKTSDTNKTVLNDKMADEKVTTATGKLSWDVPAGKYVLRETTLPGNNYRAQEDVALTITATPDTNKTSYTYEKTNFTDNNTNTVDITNYEGSSLPGTGGVGTTMFTIGGIALVVVAGGMLTIYMKKRKTSEEE
ncbi:MAG: isopeptide-forming domain-containing fimbrial protein [Clostridia bacterium]|nr:isopeptide-forming domain-containing fimbrial protein [Clostridia bacterium]